MNESGGRPYADAVVSSAVLESESPADIRDAVTAVIDNIRTVIYVERRKLEYIIAAKIAGGHVILADFHGVGKTSLARALAGSIRWDSEDMYADNVKVDRFNRIQCTVDLLPQDILGYNRFLGSTGEMIFNKGPIFAHFVLCDEINLLTPKTQGSFFQAMEEQNVTIEGKTYVLPDPFFIIATMNLKGVHLFPLPAPQLDRFMVQLSIGFPEADEEFEIIRQHGRTDGWADFNPVVDSGRLLQWKATVDEIEIHPDLVRYIVECVRRTRSHPDLEMPASPRTGVKLSRLARALAMIRGESHVSIDIVKEVFLPGVAHRLVPKDPAVSADEIANEILDSVSVEAVRAARRP
ncbi:MAG: MoxR family ATPase [Spirochaetaceae bacterium]|nr:MAG: MoxR family ATPase [Spirochaetaceae bacterium]